MKIEAKNFHLQLTYGELWTLAWDVQYSLEYSLKTHWVNHQDEWKENERLKLSTHKDMFTALGRPELHEQIFTKALEIFQEFNNKQTAKP